LCVGLIQNKSHVKCNDKISSLKITDGRRLKIKCIKHEQPKLQESYCSDETSSVK